MVARIVRLIREGASPAEFLALTFSRRAAREMRGRLEAEIGRKSLQGMMIGTYHAIALRMLREHGERLGYHSGSLTVLDPDDADLLLESVCSDLGYYRKRQWRSGLSWQRVSKYREGWYNGTRNDKLPELETIFQEYLSRLYQLNALDFGSIMLQCNRLLREHRDVLLGYQQRIAHVFCDESHDTDETQFVTQDFFSPPATFFAIYDERQVLYRWRGARPELVLQRHPSAERIELPHCFRCGKKIVEAANALISHNNPFLPPLVSATGRDGEIITGFGNEMAVARMVEIAQERGYGYGDIAILARKHSLLMSIGQALREKEIPMWRVGQGFSITDTADFKDLHAAIKLSVNEHDTFAFLRLARRLNIDITNVAHNALALGRSQFFIARSEHLLLTLLGGMNGLFGTQRPTITDLLADTICKYGMADLNAAAVDFWLKHCAEDIASDALDWYATKDQQDDVVHANKVSLLTCHAAKGLEWPCVIVAGLNEGMLPASMSIRANEVDDERRVAYVAITRAAELLMLHWFQDYTDQPGVPIAPSRFLVEMGYPAHQLA